MAMAPQEAPRKRPTAEQQAVRVDARANRHEGRKVVAMAGTGKTTTLEMLAGDRGDPGVYIAFNASTKESAAARFPRHMRVTTTHGAAYGALRMHEQGERLRPRLYGDGVAKLVRLPRCALPENALGQVVLDTVAKFCNSADTEMGLGPQGSPHSGRAIGERKDSGEWAMFTKRLETMRSAAKLQKVRERHCG